MKNTEQHYGWVTIILHWLVVIIVSGSFGLGIWMVELGYYDSWRKAGPELHKSIGLSLFILMLARVGWRFFQSQPKTLDNYTQLERKSAHAMHLLLYVMLFVIMMSGYLISTADGRGIEFFQLFEVPGLGSFFENQEDLAGLFHQYAAYLLISLVLLHALAAFKHHFVNKDITLSRMLGKRN